VPQISSVAAPAASAPAPAAGVPPTASATGDQTPSDFVSQLSAALKTLKGLAAAAGLKAQPDAADVSPTEALPSTTDAPAPDTADSAASPSDEVLELLASLGVVLVPNAQTAPLPTDGAAAATDDTAVSAALMAPPTPKAAPVQTKATAAGDTHPTNELGASPTPAPAPAPTTDAARPQTPLTTNALRAAAADAQPAQQPVQHSAQAPVPTAAQIPNFEPQLQDAGASGFEQSGTGDGRSNGKSADKTEAIGTAAPAQAGPLPEHIAAAGLSAPTVVAEAPVDPRAVNVASQIAQQVDFYKLPGNKGVRIQLHPDDLGGVQVTLRYAPGGNLELHINVEHAATGSLVEAGWSQLRDALATQGFQPDRLVMSVTGPASSSSQMDFSSSSNGNGAYRQEPGLAGFMRDGQSGQQRNGADDTRGARGWSSAAEPIAAVDDSPRNASSVGSAASRIDYRV
jgi:flagellar hook-length control protein FliK